jgi:predicted nucleotidyltransferase
MRASATVGILMDPRLQSACAEIEAHYGSRLLAAALFGSRVGCRPRIDSDWDLLLVLVPEEPIRRTLYQEWDEQVAPGIETHLRGVAPHFVHLPATDDPPSSLWLEVCTNHEILHDPSGRLATHLRTVHVLVDSGRFERRSIHGLPYWRSVG